MKMNYWFALLILVALTALCRGADAPAPADTPAPAINPAGPPSPAVPSAPAPAPALTQPLTPQPSPIQPAATPAPQPITPATPPAFTPPPARTVEAATPTPPPPGSHVVTVKQNNVNVRGQPRINSDVVTRLKRGDQVVVLDEVKLPNPKTDEPGQWAKIALPSTAFVWIHSSFVDPATKTVKATRLNVRNGPGENFSVLGRIEKGTPVKEVETKGLWLKIEPPPGTYAYVAAHLLNLGSAPVEVAAAKPAKPADPVTAVTNAVTVATNVPTDLAETKAPTLEPSAEATAASTNTLSEAIAAAEEEREERRIVTREGIVRRSVSIQAPTYFVLENKENGKTINYLHSPGGKLLLRDYDGQRILVTGEEMLDERWPNTPVITVDKLRAMP